MDNFQKNDQMREQQKNTSFDVDGKYTHTPSTHGDPGDKIKNNNVVRTIGGFLNG